MQRKRLSQPAREAVIGAAAGRGAAGAGRTQAGSGAGRRGFQVPQSRKLLDLHE